MPEPTALIFDVERFALHDGPGTRTTVFFKGCPLACAWCHNPEAMRRAPEIAYFESQCVACQACVAACTRGAREARPGGAPVLHRELCVVCGRCVEVCCAEAIVLMGRQVTVPQLLREVLRDRPFYEASGGGVTLSGGEPTLQHEFVGALLRACKAEGLHTAVETCGQTPWGVLAALLPWIDLLLYDLKHVDGPRHRALTGVGNERILGNLARLGQAGVPVEVRLPVVPGLNDDDEAVAGAARFLAGLPGLRRVAVLPYHRLGAAKHARLGRTDPHPGLQPPTPARLEAVAAILRAAGLPVHVGR